MRLAHTDKKAQARRAVCVLAHVMENEDGRVRKVNVTRVLCPVRDDDVPARAAGACTRCRTSLWPWMCVLSVINLVCLPCGFAVSNVQHTASACACAAAAKMYLLYRDCDCNFGCAWFNHFLRRVRDGKRPTTAGDSFECNRYKIIATLRIQDIAPFLFVSSR